ncbi:MAG: hypothetical protein GVY07_15795 [Bacteroidetes bacterium]|jgi:hypothetical protein|nr:hypothetical protein [Bacteroidota bacterium]
MGFIIKYNRFFSVSFEEEGSDEPIEGFRVSPTYDCHQKLQNFNLLFKQRPFGFDVFYSESPLIAIGERIRFTFGFDIPNAGIFGKYGLVKEDDDDATVYQPGLFFDNLQTDGSIITASPASIVSSGSGIDQRVSAADTYRIYSQTFKVYDSTAETVPASYQLSHLYDSTLQQTVSVNSAVGTDTIITTINSVDFEENYIDEPGPYLLAADTDPTPPHKNVYLNNELGLKSAQGVIDIYWETAQNNVADPETGQQYEITFKPK